MTKHDWQPINEKYDWEMFLKPYTMTIYSSDIAQCGSYKCSRCHSYAYVFDIGTAIRVTPNWDMDCDLTIVCEVHDL